MLAVVAAASVTVVTQAPRVRSTAELERMAARFSPTDIAADVSRLSAAERRVLATLVQASKLIDALFHRQVWAGNDALLLDLARGRSAESLALLHNVVINHGPWDELEHHEPFVPGAPARPAGANFYPEDASKADLERWMQSLSEADRARATGFFTAIRRGPDGTFRIVPYSVEYRGELTKVAALLREAAAHAVEPTLKRYLTTRADAFLTDDYYDSDVAWMELRGAVEPTIGPYEVYEDRLFNYKAAFESFITVVDEGESAKIQRFSAELQGIEDRLPIDPTYRNPKLAALAPLVVVNAIYAAGDANHGVQTAAFNLPNDERILREKGAKRVMLKNVQDAKFAKTLVPISKVVLAPADQAKLSFDAFFTHIVTHELMHGLGPHDITVSGRATTVRKELKEASSFLEEAKADIAGLYALQHLIDTGVVSKSMQDTLYTTFLASCFRSIRFGLGEAHGKGIAVQLNYLLDQGGVVVRPDGRVAVDTNKIREGVVGLAHDIMTIQAEGNYEKAKALGDRLGVVRPAVRRLLDQLADVPVDIEPRYTTAEQLLTERW
jgi:hypothetical protein